MTVGKERWSPNPQAQYARWAQWWAREQGTARIYKAGECGEFNPLPLVLSLVVPGAPGRYTMVVQEVSREMSVADRLAGPVGLSSCVQKAQRDYETEPAPPFLFEWKSPRTRCDPIPRTGAYLDVRPGTPNNVHRLDESVFTREQLPSLVLDLQPSMTAVEGGDRSDYAVRLCAAAGAETEAEAKRLLGEIRLAKDGARLTLATPQGSARSRPQADLRIQAPADVPVTIKGTYAALAVRETNAPVKLATTHARITVIDTTGDVEATASEFGIGDFSGNCGRVRLNAATEINLNITARHFDGTLEATAERPVKVLLPPGFSSPFEAVVGRARDFACRADICGEIKQSKRDGRFVFTYGSGEPLLRLRSISGPVVIDSTDRMPPP